MSAEAVDRRDVKRIAVVCLSGLGNILLFTPTLVRLAELFPGAEIRFLTIRAGNYELVSGCPLVKPVFLRQRRYNSLLDNARTALEVLALRRHRFDLSLFVFPSGRLSYNVLGFLLGARIRLNFEYPNRRTASFLATHLVPVDEALHDVEQNYRILSLVGDAPAVAGGKAESLRTRFWSEERHRRRAAELAAAIGGERVRPIVAYHPACFPDMLYKRWAPRNFAALVDRISTAYDVSHVLLGAKGDLPLLAEIRDRSSARPEIVCGEDLLTVGELLRRSALLVSNDSGLMHLGVAAGTQTIGLFGPTQEGRTAPWGEHGHVVRSPYPNLPCHRYPFAPDIYPRCCGGGPCMDAIAVEDVYGYIERHGLLSPRA